MAKPCKYTLADGTVLSYDEMRAYILENYEKLNAEANAIKEKQQQEGVQGERAQGGQSRNAGQAGGGGGIRGKAEGTGEEGAKLKKKALLNRAYAGEMTSVELQEAIERHGLEYEVEKQSNAKQAAADFIEEVGIDEALHAVRTNMVEDGMGAYVWSHIIDFVNEEIARTTNPAELERLRNWQAELLAEFDRKARSAGRFVAALADIYKNSSFGWKASEMEARWSRETGEDVSPEMKKMFEEIEAEVKDIREKIAQAEARAKAAEDALAIQNIKDANERKKASQGGAMTTERRKKADKAIAAVKNIRQKIRANSYSDATGIIAAIDLGLAAIEKAIDKGATVADAIEIGIAKINRAMKGAAWSEDRFRKDVADGFKSEGVDTGVAEPDELTGRYKVPGSLIRDLVESGINDIDVLTDAVMEEMDIENTDENHRIVRDSITGYGKTVNPTKDAIQTEISKLTGIGRLLSAIEDVKAGLRSKRSGVQRRPLEQKERDLMKQLAELTKNLPQDKADLAKYHKTALDGIKSRLRNRIADLQAEIDAKEKQPKSINKIELDAEAILLKEERDAMQAIHDEIFSKENRSDEARLRDAIKAIQQSEASYQAKIDKKAFFPPTKVELPSDPRLEQAQANRDAKKLEYEAARDKANPPALRAAEAALKSAERQLAEVNKQIADNVLEKTRKEKVVFETDALKIARAKLAERKAFLADLQEKAGIPEKKRLETLKKNAAKRIETYKRRLAEGNFAKGNYESKKGILGAFKPKVEKRTALDAEMIKLNAERLRIQNKYETALHKEQLKQRTIAQKALDQAIELAGLPRAVIATGELSFILIQGLKLSVAHPKYAAKAFQVSIRHLFSQAKSETAQLIQEASPLAYEMSKSKLALSKYNAELSAKEEMFLGGYVNTLWDYIGFRNYANQTQEDFEAWQAANPFKALERAGSGYLNTLRILRFNDGVKMLEMQGKTFENDPQAFKDVADIVNTFTGRSGLGKLEMVSKPLSVVLFSPRLWASTLKTMTPYSFYWIGKMTPDQGSLKKPWKFKASVAQKMAMADYMKFVGTTLSVVLMAAAYLNNDDDDETEVSFDPKSSDFLKIRMGSTRVDPWGGAMPMIVFQARLITGETTNAKGEVKRLGETSFVPTRLELVGQMLRNKLAPTPGMLVKALDLRPRKNPLTGEYEMQDKFGQPYSITSEVQNIYPMYWSALSELYEEQPETVSAFLTFYALLGGGVSTYDSAAPKKGMESLNNNAMKVLEKFDADIKVRPVNIDGKEMTPIQFDNYRKIKLAIISDKLNQNTDHYETLDKDQFDIELAYIQSNAMEIARSKVKSNPSSAYEDYLKTK
jgi:hypothetical protein